MRDYLPKIIGVESFEHYIGPYRGYDLMMDPSASNVFATAAFRFGHATISPILRRLNESFQEHEQFPHLRLHHTSFSPWRIVKEGQYMLMKLPIGSNNIYFKHTKHTIKRVEEMKNTCNKIRSTTVLNVCYCNSCIVRPFNRRLYFYEYESMHHFFFVSLWRIHFFH